jgi:hypothetical protein
MFKTIARMPVSASAPLGDPVQTVYGENLLASLGGGIAFSGTPRGGRA